MFASANYTDLVKEVCRLALENIGINVPIAKEKLTLEDFMRTRLGLCRFLINRVTNQRLFFQSGRRVDVLYGVQGFEDYASQ